MYRLAICIPTFNRVACLEKLLKSVVPQLEKDVQIVVSDNASSDGTEELASRYPIKYIRQPTNIGPDRNALQAIAAADAKYCWIFGDDDLFEPWAMRRVLPHLNRNLAGISVGVRTYDCELRHPIPDWNPTKVRGLTAFADMKSFIDAMGTSMSFIGRQLFRRDLWLKVVEEEDISQYFGGYFHVYVIYRIMQMHPSWLYIPQKCVRWRSSNEARSPQEAISANQRLLMIDAFSYEKILNDVFGPASPYYRKSLDPFLRIHLPARIRKMKYLSAPFSQHLQNLEVIGQKYWREPLFWWKIAPHFLAPRSLLFALKRACKAALQGMKT
ncbi:MAG: glycosyltransferase [Simkaniaceae bacterium]|nr:glycosyltransferase [Simkaniaceae bacterium]